MKSNLPREFVQSFNEQTVDGEPNRTTPVRVTTEQVNVGLARQVIDRVHFVALFERVRIFLVLLGHGANAVGRQELVFFEQIVQHADQACRALVDWSTDRYVHVTYVPRWVRPTSSSWVAQSHRFASTRCDDPNLNSDVSISHKQKV